MPALVVTWRKRSGRWEAWLIALAEDGMVLQMWAPADRLRPIETVPNRAWE